MSEQTLGNGRGDIASWPQLKHTHLSEQGRDEAAAAAGAAEVERRYNQERDKRLQEGVLADFVDLYDHEKFRHFKGDPWVKDTTVDAKTSSPDEGSRSEFLIVGAGYGGLLFAVRLLQAGFKLEDIRIVDSAGGFGGTWYWNRYPGLMCDVESYIYMPLLEETGYIPTRKYTSSNELREHADRVAKQWKLDQVACFRHRVISLEWNDTDKEWLTQLEPQNPQGTRDSTPITIRSRFSILSTGFTLIPRIPQVPGIDKFEGSCFHTARWDYNTTGGSSEDDKPELTRLKDKRVAIIGTGATAIQVVPTIAPWVKELTVFQRTPSSVDRRDNRPTDFDWARKAFSKPGWQAERAENYHAYLNDAKSKPPVNLVNDGWTRMPGYRAMAGNPDLDTSGWGPEDIQKYVEYLHAQDLPRQEGIRKRIDDTVTHPATAEKLKPWYPSWCKRPCFHDEYLEAFNLPNVRLVDTNGRGVKEITSDGIKVFDEDKHFNVDVLILSTGYRSPVLYSPAGRVGIEVTGRNGVSLDKKWSKGVTTLHGMMSHDFPNLFWPGLNQAGGSANFIYCIDGSAVHVAEILSLAAKRQSSNCGNGYSFERAKYKYNFIVEPTKAGEEDWSDLIVSQASAFAAMGGCTPSYFNAEGKSLRNVSPQEQLKQARGAVWAKGATHFRKYLETWRATRELKGLEIAPVYH